MDFPPGFFAEKVALRLVSLYQYHSTLQMLHAHSVIYNRRNTV